MFLLYLLKKSLVVKKMFISLQSKTKTIIQMKTQITKKELFELIDYTQTQIIYATKELNDNRMVYGTETVSDQAKIRIKELISLQTKLISIHENN